MKETNQLRAIWGAETRLSIFGVSNTSLLQPRKYFFNFRSVRNDFENCVTDRKFIQRRVLINGKVFPHEISPGFVGSSRRRNKTQENK